MKREPIQFGNLYLEDWGSEGCKVTMLDPEHPDESIAQPLSHEQSAEMAKWLTYRQDVIAAAIDLPNMPGTFAEKLKLACAKRGVAVRLAEKLRTGHMTVRHWIYGHSIPNDAQAKIVAGFFGWDVTETMKQCNAERLAWIAKRDTRKKPAPVVA